MPFRRVWDIERLQTLVGAMLLIGENLELPAVLQTIVQTAVDTVDARYGALGVLDDSGSALSEFVTVGISPEQAMAIGHLPEGRGVLGLLIKEPRPLRLGDIAEHPERAGFPLRHPPMTSFLGVPVVVRDVPFGNLYLTEKRGGASFTQEDEDVASTLALAAALAIDKARVHARLRQLTLSEERERIARDLHDTTIRRLFGVGLTLQGARRLLGQPEAGERLQQAIDALDGTIRQIRTTVFAITRPARRVSGGSLRGEILHVVEQTTDDAGLEVEVDLDGEIDREVSNSVAEHLLLSVREMVTAAATSSGVSSLSVEAAMDDGAVVVRVGYDPSSDADPPDLTALVERARLLGGHCWADTADDTIQVTWRVTRLE